MSRSPRKSQANTTPKIGAVFTSRVEEATEVWDVSGLYVTPGLVDIHVVAGASRHIDLIRPPYGEEIAALDDLPEVFLDGRLKATGAEPIVYGALLARDDSYIGEGEIVGAVEIPL